MQKRALGIPGFQKKLAQVGGVDISYWIGGRPEGHPVLLWHGFLGTSVSWHKVMPLLADAGCYVLAPDMRGFGDSAKPEGTDGYDGNSLADEFRALLKQIDFGSGRPLTIAAHDMGAPPALLWTAHYPSEVSTLFYIEAPVMLEEILSRIIVFTPEAMKRGSMWWWLLPLAPGVPERLIVGNERAFLTWFYEGATANPSAIDASTVEEYLRTFSGPAGVLGAMGVYRAAFTTVDQTSPLTINKVQTPVVAIGGAKGLGGKVKEMVERVAANVTGSVIDPSGHFLPEEAPQELVRSLLNTLETTDRDG
jgi:pimeloyl-ACP methyl ester carboxylesterase